MICKTHPKYKVLKSPISECRVCRLMWDEKCIRTSQEKSIVEKTVDEIEDTLTSPEKLLGLFV